MLPSWVRRVMAAVVRRLFRLGRGKFRYLDGGQNFLRLIRILGEFFHNLQSLKNDMVYVQSCRRGGTDDVAENVAVTREVCQPSCNVGQKKKERLRGLRLHEVRRWA